MTRLRRDTKRFKSCAVNSLLLAIEMFNRPHDVGRIEAVLMLLQHAFEMFLKAAIYEKRGIISDSRVSIAFGFDKCLGIARSDLLRWVSISSPSFGQEILLLRDIDFWE